MNNQISVVFNLGRRRLFRMVDAGAIPRVRELVTLDGDHCQVMAVEHMINSTGHEVEIDLEQVHT